MKPFRIARRVPWVLLALLASLAGCRLPAPKPPSGEISPSGDLKPTTIEYVDEDGFDRLLELALVNREPAIVVQTGRRTADWGPRLNAWIAAWNRGGRSRSNTVRGQTPPVKIDGDSIREFRLLVDGLLDRIEEAGLTGSAWYRDQRERSRRVSLLKPYNLRFHKGEEDTIQLIFFHESFSTSYARFVRQLMGTDSVPVGEWTRNVECSQCSASMKRAGRLVGGEARSDRP